MTQSVVFFTETEGPTIARRRGHTEEQILAALRPAEGGTTVVEVCREVGIREQRLRDECLNVEVFFTLEDVREKLVRWQEDYNRLRPHSSLQDQAPACFAAQWSTATPLAPAFSELLVTLA
jgi:transposase InsO family protein